MTDALPARTLRYPAVAGLLALSITLLAHVDRAQATPGRPAPSVISFIGHETDREMTRVILHADAPIDYRGGMLRGTQVVLDLANVRISLPDPVVELGAPEVDRVVIGPEISRDGEKVLKLRLTGVKAGSHKVVAKGNELYIELTALKGSRDGHKGLPKLINNGAEVMARASRAGGAETTR